MIIGWIGLGLLMVAYILLIFKCTSKYFLMVDALASFLLTIHAVMIKDMPFFIVNGFITIFLIIKQLKGGIK